MISDDGRDPARSLRDDVRCLMEEAWRPPGYCVPSANTYRQQWLWDSCFHSVIWAELGSQRAVTELESALQNQLPSGFVPHMTYWDNPQEGRSFWGRPLVSAITQPPMYGHAAANLIRKGFRLPPELQARVELGLRHLLQHRERTPANLIAVFHPWETGCDDSLRWDYWRSGDPSVAAWRQTKGSLVGALQFATDGSPVGSSLFSPGPIGFSALVAWNSLEYAATVGSRELEEMATHLAEAVSDRWDARLQTWVDDGPHALTSGSARTVDALLGLLVDPRPEAVSQLIDPAAFGGAAGPSGVHKAEPDYDPNTYWRGGSWPQLSYLLWRATQASGAPDVAMALAKALRLGAAVSGLSEYWHPDTGVALGAKLQTWAGLALCVPG